MATPQETATPSPSSQFGINTLVPEEPTPVDTPTEDVVQEDTRSTEEIDAEVRAREEQAEPEALKHGWVPRDEWRGDPNRWRPASEFLEVRENMRRIASDENSTLRAKIAAMEQREAERSRRENEARERITNDTLQSELAVAYDNQDWGKVREVTDKLLDHKVQKVAAPKAPAIDPAIVDSANRFKAANSWVETDKVLGSNFALELKNIVDLKLTDSFDDALKLAKERVTRMYPDRFRVKPNGRHGIADTGGTTGGYSSGRTWMDLKPVYREQAEKDIAAKRYTKEEYLHNALEDPNEYFRR